MVELVGMHRARPSGQLVDDVIAAIAIEWGATVGARSGHKLAQGLRAANGLGNNEIFNDFTYRIFAFTPSDDARGVDDDFIKKEQIACFGASGSLAPESLERVLLVAVNFNVHRNEYAVLSEFPLGDF